MTCELHMSYIIILHFKQETEQLPQTFHPPTDRVTQY